MIDAHCHLYELPEEEWVNNGLEAMICAGSDLESSRRAIELAENYPNVYATVGMHPEAISEFHSLTVAQLRSEVKKLISRKKVVAVGECGLDTGSEEEVELFKFNINLAKETGLPLVVHCRNMFGKVFEILDYDRVQMHCFTGNEEEMRECVGRGWYISFGGILTFKKSGELRRIASLVPENKLLVETDSPYLAPEPVRGSRNFPKNVKYVVDCLAEARGMEPERIEAVTNENAKKLFNLGYDQKTNY